MKNGTHAFTIIKRAQLTAVTVRSIVFSGFIAIVAVTSHFLLRSSPLIVFILFFLAERVYESYFKVGRRADSTLTQDRHCNRVILAFCVMVFSAVLEFYFTSRPIVSAWTAAGFILLLTSGYLRWTAIKAVGDDWAIDTFAIPSTIQRQGPYSYVRHPYYLGVFLESVAFPMILNSWYTLLFGVCVVAPLEGYRALLEEKVLVDKFGWIYIRFKREVNRFWPTLIKRRVYERRSRIGGISNPARNEADRRSREELPPLGQDRRQIIRGVRTDDMEVKPSVTGNGIILEKPL